jgi:hypothetical protein
MAQTPFNPISGVSTHQDCVNIINLNVNDSETRISALESSNSDWNSVSGLSEILNKPTLGTAAASNTGDFATSIQGDKADTALQSGDNVSTLTNDAGYLTTAPVAPVDSVNTQTGAVVLDADDISDATTTNKFATQAQLDNADNALQSVVGGTNVTIDNTDQKNPIINAAGGGGPSGTILSGTTSNATPTEIFVDGTSPNRVDVVTGSTITFSALVAARSATESAGYKIEGVIKNDAGTAALVGVVAKTVFAEEDIAWDITVTAANNALTFIVTGDSADSVSWEVTLNKTEAT